jgi:hypothetical protein
MRASRILGETTMKDFLSRISSYNLLNYLLPGVVFVIIAERTTQYNLIHENIVLGAFLYYFIGLVISRFGSLIMEPFLKLVKFLKFSDYSDFVASSKKDGKIELLSEVNNTYRTTCSLFVLLALIKIYESLEAKCALLRSWNTPLLLIALLTMFLFSYRKQTAYVRRRVEANREKSIVE